MTLKDYYDSFIHVRGTKSLTKEYYLKALEYYNESSEDLINPEAVMGSILFKRRNKLDKFAKCYNYTKEELEEIIKIYISKYATSKELVMFLAGDKDSMDFLHQFILELDNIDVLEKYHITHEQLISILKYYGQKEASVILNDEEKSRKIWQDIKRMKEDSDTNIVDIFNLYAKEHYITSGLVRIVYYLHEDKKDKLKM